MFKYYNALQNQSGDALRDHLVRLFDRQGNGVAIFADPQGTPIANASGVTLAARTDSNGMVRFYVPDGIYELRYYDAQDVFIGSDSGVPMQIGAAFFSSVETGLAGTADGQCFWVSGLFSPEVEEEEIEEGGDPIPILTAYRNEAGTAVSLGVIYPPELKADVGHQHPMSDVEGLAAALVGKADSSAVAAALAAKQDTLTAGEGISIDLVEGEDEEPDKLVISAAPPPFTIPFTMDPPATADEERLLIFKFAEKVTFPADFAGAVSFSITAPDVDEEYVFQRVASGDDLGDAEDFCTMTVADDGTITFASDETEFDVGDLLLVPNDAARTAAFTVTVIGER